MTYAITPSLPALLDIADSQDKFPIRRVYCVGRNYADHAIEMGSNPNRETPFFFCKPNDDKAIIAALPNCPALLGYPPATDRLDYEVELVVALGAGGYNISPQDANSCIFGYATGLDMTRRDLQAMMKQTQRPWEVGKVFDGCGIIGQIHQADCIDISQSAIYLTINDTICQHSHTKHMIWSIPEIISELSKLFVLSAGDVIFTGTPAGVGAVERDEVIFAHIDGLSDITVIFQ